MNIHPFYIFSKSLTFNTFLAISPQWNREYKLKRRLNSSCLEDYKTILNVFFELQKLHMQHQAKI